MNKVKQCALIIIFILTNVNNPINAGVGKLFRILGHATKTAAGAYVTRESFNNLMNYHKVHLGVRGIMHDINYETDGLLDFISREFPKISNEIKKEVCIQYVQKGTFLFAGLYTTYAGIKGIIKELATETRRTHIKEKK